MGNYSGQNQGLRWAWQMGWAELYARSSLGSNVQNGALTLLDGHLLCFIRSRFFVKFSN